MSLYPEAAWSDERKIASLKPTFGLRIKGILLALEAKGWQPTIYFAWRSVETQRRLVAAGFSKTMNSRHCTGIEGQGEAADIIDERYWWGAPLDPNVPDPEREAGAEAFFEALGKLAHAEGLVWGGNWGWDHAHIELPHEVR